MKKTILAAAFLAAAVPAMAGEATPPSATVTLTSAELRSLIEAENTRAVGEYVAREKAQAAQAVYDKVRSAFAPPAP